MKQFVRGVKIIGTGSYVPEKVLTNEELEKMVDTSAEWIEKTLGIKERRIATPSEATSDLAVEAAKGAISDAGLKIEDIDLIIVATSTPDRISPSTACIVQDKLKAYNSVAFDIAAVCSGFLYAMSVAAQFIRSHVYDNVLVVGADKFSYITDWSDRNCVFFGDGAGAAILSHSNTDEGFLAFRLYSDGRGSKCFTVPSGGSETPTTTETLNSGGQYFKMDGKAVYNTAVQALPQAIMQVLNDTDTEIGDVDFLIPHQPSIGILKETAHRIGMPFDKVMTNMDRYANTSGGTIPIMLDEVHKARKLKSGSTIIFAAVGAGWTYGAALLRWT